MPQHDNTSTDPVNNIDSFKLFSALNQQNFNINPLYVQLTGDIIAGYFLTQMCFIARYHNWEEFQITDERLEQKYHLSPKQLTNRRAMCINLGVLTVTQKGFPKKNHYWVNIEVILKLTSALDSKASEPDTPKGLTPDTPNGVTERPTLSVVPKGNLQTRPNGVTGGAQTASLSLNDLVQMNNNNDVVDKINKRLPNLFVDDSLIHEWVAQYGEAYVLEKVGLAEGNPTVKDINRWLPDAIRRDYKGTPKQTHGDGVKTQPRALGEGVRTMEDPHKAAEDRKRVDVEARRRLEMKGIKDPRTGGACDFDKVQEFDRLLGQAVQEIMWATTTRK